MYHFIIKGPWYSDRAVYSDLNPLDGGQSLYPMGTALYLEIKMVELEIIIWNWKYLLCALRSSLCAMGSAGYWILLVHEWIAICQSSSFNTCLSFTNGGWITIKCEYDKIWKFEEIFGRNKNFQCKKPWICGFPRVLRTLNWFRRISSRWRASLGGYYSKSAQNQFGLLYGILA